MEYNFFWTNIKLQVYWFSRTILTPTLLFAILTVLILENCTKEGNLLGAEIVENIEAASDTILIIPEKPKPAKPANKMTAEAYIKRFAAIAQIEHKKFGIPASITLAQGILESGCGNSQLCRRSNNHFGIKCWHRNCKNGHCVNYHDDDPDDRFMVYKNAWHSYRHHSIFLQQDNYKKCFDCGDDYKCWAKELKAAGYATSKTYTKKLLSLINTYKLYNFDK